MCTSSLALGAASDSVVGNVTSGGSDASRLAVGAAAGQVADRTDDQSSRRRRDALLVGQTPTLLS